MVGELHLMLELAATAEPETAQVAAHCLLKAAHLHPGDAAAVLAAPENIALLVCLLDPTPAGGAAAGSQGQQQQERGQPEAQQQLAQQARPAFSPELAPLLLLVLASVVEARPELLHQHGPSLRHAVGACLAAVGDPGLKRRWSPLLA